MGLLSRRLFVKVSEHSENEQSLTHVLGRVFETLADGGYLEGAFSGSSVSTQLRVWSGGRPPKDTEKGVFRARKGRSRGSKAGEDNSENPTALAFIRHRMLSAMFGRNHNLVTQAARMKQMSLV